MRLRGEERYLEFARVAAMCSTCLRRQFGAVIVVNDAIVGTGYNGSARGEMNCCDTGYCEREEQKIPPGERYEKCIACHAEVNACLEAGRKLTIGGTLYLYGQDAKTGERIEPYPCLMCMRTIKNCGIKDIITYSRDGFIKRELVKKESWICGDLRRKLNLVKEEIEESEILENV